MPNPPLAPGLVDAFLANLDQLPADHQGPVGRIKGLINAQTKHYTHASQFNPAKISLEPRNGFASLPQTVRDQNGDDIADAEWNDGSLLDTFGDQLVAIDDRVPRVFNGYDAWAEYSDVKILTNKLREESLVGGYGIRTTPNQCTLGHVQAVCYTQHPNATTWEVCIGFREAPGSQTDQNRRAVPLDGPWIVAPFVLHAESTSTVVTVFSDGTRFFFIWNSDPSTHDFAVWAYSTAGKFIASTTFSKLDTTRTPGWWDVTVDKFDPTKLIHVQPAGDTDDPSVDVHVRFTSIQFTGPGITLVGNTDTTIACNSWCAWLENDRDAVYSYLVTSGPGETDQTMHAYQVYGLSNFDEWTIGDVTPRIDAITGYLPDLDTSFVIAPADVPFNSAGDTAFTFANASFVVGDVGSQILVTFGAPNTGFNTGYTIASVVDPNTVVTTTPWLGLTFTPPASGSVILRPPAELYPVIGTLEPSSVTGPQFDPQARRIFTYHTNHDASTVVRTSASQALVSKTTKIGDDRFDVTFYESGSGLSADSSLEPDITSGDYFTGSAKQSIPVQPGDYFTGPDQTLITPTPGGPGVVPIAVGAPSGPFDIDDTGTPDQVEYVANAGGTPYLKWTFKATTGQAATLDRMTVAGSDFGLANFTWEVIAGVFPDNSTYTRVTNTVGGTLGNLITPHVFVGSGGGGGTVEFISMTGYSVLGLGEKYDQQTADAFLKFSTMVVSGNTTGANNGTKTIATVDVDSALGYSLVRIVTGSESTSMDGFTAVMNPSPRNVFGFAASQLFSDALIDSALIIENDTQFPENNSPVPDGFVITDTGSHSLECDDGDTGSTRSEFFTDATARIELAQTTVPFTFFIQDLAADLAVNAFRFRGAILQASTADPRVTGLYRIIDFGPALDGTLYTERIVQSDDVPAYDFVPDQDSVFIFFPVATTQPFQPTYFLTPVLPARPIVGMFDRLNAYNNWRISGVNTLDGHLTNVSDIDGTLHFVAPTTQERVTTANANQQLVQAAIVGIKGWTISPEYGVPVNNLIPGCQAVSFEGDTFPEDGFALAPEAPWLVSQDEAAANQLGLQHGGTYVYTVVIESQDSGGQRISSPPSPALIIGPLAGNNNQITIAGDLPVPWNVGPIPYDDTYGVTNRVPITISVYRSSYRNGIETTTQYKITSDLTPNALAPITADNASGFSFSNGQWQYIDQNPDLVIQVNEPLYSNVALPRFGAPAFTDGEFWLDRYWIIDSAGNIWFSSAVTDGQRPSWFPGFKIAPPPGDRPVSVRGLQQFLVVTCEKSVYYVPATALPSVSLAELGQVAIPSLIPLPFPNGCTGQAITTPGGVMYASTALGIWNVTRSLSNDPVSLNAVDLFTALTHKVQGLAIDRDQRMAVSTGDDLIVYDFVSGLWAQWLLPVAVTSQIANYNGRFVVRTGPFVLLQTDDAFDEVDSILYPIDWQVRMAGLSFSSVRAFVRLWRMQVVGKWRGIHNMRVTFGYPDDFPDDPTVCPVLTPMSTTPYLIEAIPGHGRASQFDVTIDVNHDGEEVPGDSCSIEVLSCRVGLQPGQRQVTPGQRV